MRKYFFHFRFAALVVSTFLMLGFVSRATAQTPTPVSACGNISGSVILTANVSASSTCFTVVGDNTTINGNGHSITVGVSPWRAVDAQGHNHLTVQNISTDDVIFFSGSANNGLVQNSTAGWVQVFNADDVTVDHNTLNAFIASGTGDDPVYRTRLTNNTISGDDPITVEFVGGYGTNGPAATNFVITDNIMTNTYHCGGAGQDSCDEPKVLYMRSNTGATVSGNTMHAIGQAMSLRLRDGSDDGTYTDNTIWGSENISGGFGAFSMTSGNTDKHFPRDNTFTRNVFRADVDIAVWLQAEGPNNVFTYNTIWANSNAYTTLVSGGDVGIFDHNTFYNAGSGAGVSFGYRDPVTTTFTNNIFAYRGTTIYDFDCSNSDSSVTALCRSADRYLADYNLFYNQNGAASFGLYGANFAALKTYVNPDDVHSIEGNPVFTNTGSGDFSLAAGSPAINAASDGTNIGAVQSGACTESWSCTAWSTCVNSIQSRACTDTHACGMTTSKPSESQACVVVPTTDAVAPATIHDLRVL